MEHSVAAFHSVQSASSVIHRASMLQPAAAEFPSLQLYWLDAFLKCYGEARSLAFTGIATNDGKLTALFPFQFSDVPGCLEFVCNETADVTDVFAAEAALESAVELTLQFWLERGVRRFRFERLPSASPTLAAVTRGAVVLGGSVALRVGDILPFIRFDPAGVLDWGRYAESATIRRYLQKRHRRRQQSTVFEIVTDPEGFTRIWPMLKEIHARRWAARGEVSKYLDPRRERFIGEVCVAAATRGQLLVPIIKMGDRIVAYIIAFRIGTRVCDWNTSFDPTYRRMSPGALLLIEFLEALGGTTIERYEFLRGAEEHKLLWATGHDCNVTIEVGFDCDLSPTARGPGVV